MCLCMCIVPEEPLLTELQLDVCANIPRSHVLFCPQDVKCPAGQTCVARKVCNPSPCKIVTQCSSKF